MFLQPGSGLGGGTGSTFLQPGSALAFLKPGLEVKKASTPLVIVTVIGVVADTDIDVAFAKLMGAGVGVLVAPLGLLWRMPSSNLSLVISQSARS